jgi:hypothetical protein
LVLFFGELRGVQGGDKSEQMMIEVHRWGEGSHQLDPLDKIFEPSGEEQQGRAQH